jgi:indolepyruvate ferredoxin oxidoreductase alpha subunit
MDMVKQAFDISEAFSTIVLIRTTTRINHQSAIVNLQPFTPPPFEDGDFRASGKTFATVGARARDWKLKLLAKIEAVREAFETSNLNQVHDGSPEYGVIVSGISYNYVLESAQKLGITPSILKLGTTFPLPEKLVANFIQGKEKVMIVEELSPFLELRVTAIAKDVNPTLQIIGKKSGHFSEAFEYNVPIVLKVMQQVFGGTAPMDYDQVLADAEALKGDLTPRVPVFCPGCPHRATFWAVQQALAGKQGQLAFMNDIGCYSMLLLNADIYAKIHADDHMLSMGSCLGTSCGVKLGAGENNLVLAAIGDSTLFHAGMPGILNLAYHGDDVKVLVLDNSVTAMTGQQANPGTGYGSGGKETRKAQIEDIVRALGIDNIIIVDPFDTKVMRDQIKPVFDGPGPAVIISRGPCALWNDRNKRKRGEKIRPFYVDQDLCHKCHTCMRDFYCPAIRMQSEKTEYTDENGKTWVGYSSYISPDLCDGCGVCSILCPYTNYLDRSERDVIKPLGTEREIRHDL